MVELFISSVIAISSVVAAPTTADWHADYGKALTATRNDDRPLLIVLDVPSDPEAAVETAKLEVKGEQSKLLDAYQRCHVDVSTEYGKKVAEVFGATKFPFTAIIDKTGSVVICKKMGKLSSDEWKETLAKYQDGERRIQHTSFFRGDNISSSVSNPGYCPSCQLRAQQSNN